MLKIVAITGRNRAGKTSLAKHLLYNLELDGNIVDYYPFAQPLKEELVGMGFSWEYLRKKSQKARRLMQAYGDARREIDPNYFLKKWEARVKLAAESGVNALVSDDLYHWKEVKALCRFASAGGFSVSVVLVNRPSLPPLTAEDLAYESVKEQQEIEKHIIGKLPLGCRTDTPYNVNLKTYGPVVNDDNTVRQFLSSQAVKDVLSFVVE